jgi:hypothetical protein
VFFETRSRSVSGREISSKQHASTTLRSAGQPTPPSVSAEVRKLDAMKEDPKSGTQSKNRRSVWRLHAAAAALIAVIQACMTINGRGIEGFVLWVMILFVGYWLFFTFLAWLWQKYRDRA